MAPVVAVVSALIIFAGQACPQESRPDSRPANHLAGEASPYLLQHAHNPVDWYPWGDEAFARATREQKPIFLSIGYASCHWCHVMERESFENPVIAKLLNESFICIKVDREERPDVDRIYLQAAIRVTGQGGWPLSVFLTPDRKPFFAGTYFPPDDGPNQRGFRTIVRSVAEAWKQKRADLIEAAAQLSRVIELDALPLTELARRADAASLVAASQPTPEAGQPPTVDRRTREILGIWDERRPAESPPADLMAAAAERLHQIEDEKGGFGNAPKFPAPTNALLLLRHWARHPADGWALDAVRRQYDAMARGGIRDHLAGGFHRYAVDRYWLTPHFEKMLYDQALNARVLLELSQATGDERYATPCRETLDFALSDLRGPGGGFFAALDASVDGEEGASYVWTREQVAAVLRGDELRAFQAWAGFDGPPGKPGEALTIAERKTPAMAAAAVGISEAALGERLAGARTKLLLARRARPQPARIEQVITGWNAWMVSSYARAALVLNEARYRDAALATMGFLESQLRLKDGLYARRLAGGDARHTGELGDHAAMIEALLDLHELTLDPGFLARAREVAAAVEKHFGAADGAFYDSVEGDLLFRTREFHDGAWPSGTAGMNVALARLARISGEPADLERARRALAPLLSEMARAPADATYGIIAWDLVQQPVARVAFGGPLPVVRLLRAPLSLRYLPQVVMTRDDAPSESARATVCLDELCLEPVSRTDRLFDAIDRALHGNLTGATTRKR